MLAGRAAKPASRSTVVPRLSPRQPWPRAWRDRVRLVVSSVARAPWALIPIAGLVVGGWMFHEYIYSSPYFELQRLEINGNQRLTTAALLDALRTRAGIEPGIALPLVHPEEVAALLREFPEIRAADVRREWPDGLVITVHEATPRGILVTPQDSVLFDSEGRLLAAPRADDFRNRALPVLAADLPGGLQPGSVLPARIVPTVLEYDALIGRRLPTLAADISEYRWLGESGLEIALADGTVIHCGNRAAAEVGPLIEALLPRLATSGAGSRLTIVSDRHAALAPAPPLLSPPSRRGPLASTPTR